jgi:hypothetical protein
METRNGDKRCPFFLRPGTGRKAKTFQEFLGYSLRSGLAMREQCLGWRKEMHREGDQ